MLIYAAFKDQANAVAALLDSGFDASELDVLIALELQREYRSNRSIPTVNVHSTVNAFQHTL